MRKSKVQQKNEVSRQLKLFDWRAVELTGEVAGGNGIQPLNRDELLSVLERQRTLTVNLLERIVDYGNLMRSYKQVKENGGSSGIDGMETDDLRDWLGKNINTLRVSLLNEQYKVDPVLTWLVEHVKETGCKPCYGSQLVCPTRATIPISEVDGLIVNGNRRGTIKYARWCGGTAA
jgi:hypothetical protein